MVLCNKLCLFISVSLGSTFEITNAFQIQSIQSSLGNTRRLHQVLPCNMNSILHLKRVFCPRNVLRMTRQDDATSQTKPLTPSSSSLPNPQDIWTDLVETWKEMMGPAFDDDQSPAALAVKFRLESLKETDEILKNSQEEELRDWAIQEQKDALKELLPDLSSGNQGLVVFYWQVRWERMSR